MKTVIIYKEQLLAVSETFIAEQAGALRSVTPQYVALAKTSRPLSVQGKPIYLTRLKPGLYTQWRLGLYRRIPIAPWFHLRVRRVRASMIHAHFASDGLQISDLSEKLRLPLIVTLHGADITVRQAFSPRYAKLWQRASLFICVSKFIRNKALEAGFPAEKLRVHSIGIDLGKFRRSDTARTRGIILFVGRLVEKKGCGTLIRALDQVRKVVPESSLVVIGDGPLRPALTKLAADLDLPCTFLGAQPAQEVGAWMQKASIFCAPSQTAENGDSEGLGMVFLEAQACGLPVVSTLHGGIPEAVRNGETGLLVPEGDAFALGNALIQYLRDPVLAAQHAKAGRSWVEECFDLSKQTRLLEDIYAEFSS